MIKIFDTHAHYDDDAFANDQASLIESLPAHGVLKVTNVGANLQTSVNSIDLAQKYDYIYAAVGVHPSDTDELENLDGEAEIYKLAKSSDKVVAIGEIGLDYHYEDTDKALQQKWFAKQIEISKELNLPMIIHSRDAARDTVDIMNKYDAGKTGGVVHCFSYTKELAEIFLKMGFFIGIGGVVTFKNSKKLKEALEVIPLDKIVLETDAPYLAPDPYRGKRNSSIYIPYVVSAIAEIKHVSEDEIYETTWSNAHRLYGLQDV